MNNYLIDKKIKLDIEKFNLKEKGVRKYLQEKIHQYIEDEDGAGVIELVLIIVVLIGFVVVFKDKIKELLDNTYEKINTQADSLYGSD